MDKLTTIYNYTNIIGKTHIGWNVTYDTDGNIETYYTAYYIDENNFEFNGCIFTRLTGEIQTD